MQTRSGAEIPVAPLRLELPLVFAMVMMLAMGRDWVLNETSPTVWSYLLAPTVAVLSGALGAWLLGRVTRQPLAWTETLTIVLGINIVLQACATMLRLAYYLTGTFPGGFYLALLGAITLGFGVLAYRQAAGQEWRAAVTLTLVQTGSELLVGSLLIGPESLHLLGI
jgi:hypothetical protein